MIHDLPKVRVALTERVQPFGDVIGRAIFGNLDFSLNQIAYFVVKLLVRDFAIYPSSCIAYDVFAVVKCSESSRG